MAASAAARRDVDIPAGPIGDAIAALSRQLGLTVGYAGALPNVATPGLHGSFEAAEALRRLLRGTRLRAVPVDRGVFRLEPTAASVVRRDEPAAAAEDIVVLGTKRRETLADVPFAMTVIDNGRSRRRAGSLGTIDVVAAAGDVQLTNLGPGRNRLFIRGIADSAFSGPTQATVSIYLDDARINFNTPDPDLRLIDVDRVEVLKGPQGSLYGTGALGGIYRIVPNKPAVGETSGSVALGASTVSHGAIGASAEAVLNLPVAGESGALRVAAYGTTDGGWIDDTGRHLSNVNRVVTKGVRASTLLDINGGWTLELEGTTQLIGARDSQYSVVSVGRLDRSTALAEPSDNDFVEGHLTATGHVGRLDLSSTTAFVSHSIDNRYDASLTAPLFGLQAPLGFDERQTLRLLTHETRLTDASLERPWVAGVALLSANTNLQGDLAVAATPERVLNLNHDINEAALFGEATLPITRRLEATGGLRLSLTLSHDESDKGREDRSTKLAATPMLALRWRPAANAQIYARFARALRPGGLNPSGVPISFDSDRLDSFELGTRISTSDSRLTATVDLFRVRWRNIQSDLLQPDGLVATANVGTGRNQGADVAMTARLGGGWRIEAGGVVQDSELDRAIVVAGRTQDAGLPSVPNQSVRLGAGRDLVLGDLRLSLDASARYVGRSRLSFDPALDRRMGGYTSVDVEAAIALSQWSLSVTGSNLLQDHGDTFSFGNPFSIRSLDQHVPLRPRTIAARVARTF